MGLISHQHVPFTTNNLRDFEARLNRLHFVFNLNDQLISENQNYYCRQKSGYSYGKQ